MEIVHPVIFSFVKVNYIVFLYASKDREKEYISQYKSLLKIVEFT